MDKNTNDNTTITFSKIELLMNNHSNHSRVRKIVFGMLILILNILLLLIFFLPQFQTSNMSITGNIFFSKDDIRELSSIKNSSNLFLNSKECSESLIFNSNDLIVSVEINNDGLKASMNVKESYPLIMFEDSIYYSKGVKYDVILNDVESLNLSEERKTILKEKYQSKHDLVPVVHFPFDNVSTDSIKEASLVFDNIDLDSLYSFKSIYFINDNNDSNWSNVISILIEIDDKKILFENVRSDMLNVCFSKENYSNIISSVIGKVNKKEMNTNVFAYGDEKLNVFTFKFIIKDKSIIVVEKGNGNE